ncbi:MAG: UDP-glucose/GDP-mannose dehydrogenase family protein [Proteobacteria bacterium]|nr:UDP-glucose/GDP-mannose dehydrogenase family protein [Pseudomonadota bacterium]NBP14410.1 UDP-glucose/GDP-mannose dehydrogenase family protein [bacterium]
MSGGFINIVGYGYVGSALGYLCKQNNVDFCVFDVVAKTEGKAVKCFDKLSELVRHSEQFNQNNVYFVCVPTPSGDDGSCNTSIVESVIEQIQKLAGKKTSVIIKSTVQPGTCRKLHEQFGSDLFSIIFCPEFLKERTFQEDMFNASFCLLGGSNRDDKLEMEKDVINRMYAHKLKLKQPFEILVHSYEECELFKYTLNVYLAVKVWYFNEIHDVAERLNVDYDRLKELFRLDPRIGSSHTHVPGPDGKRGFGGKCLPKETRGMAFLQNSLGLDNSVLQRILERNLEMRGPHY